MIKIKPLGGALENETRINIGAKTMPRPMKLWEVMSAFRDRKDILEKVLGSARWRDDYGEIYQNFEV